MIATTAAERMWPIPLVCEYIDGINWRLRFRFQFVSPSPDFPSVDLEAGEETDFASIPRLLWWLLHPTHKEIGKAAVVHDHYYRNTRCPVTRLQADQMLASGMEALGAPRWKREVVYNVVRAFGRFAFKPRSIAP